MDRPRRLDDVSNQEFRDLAEAPLSAEDANADPELATTLDDLVDEEILEADLDEEILRDDDDLVNEELSTESYQVILETDLEGVPGADSIHAPDMDAPDRPGEIDIEDLDEDALDGTDLPEDARLDRLEE